MAIAAPAAHADRIPLSQWEPAKGDMFIADTAINVGYIRDKKGNYAEFKIGSGQKRWVYYIGRSYNAATPDGWWVVKSTKIQSDRWTFGDKGFFMRLSWNGDKDTPYGVHAMANVEEKLAREDRYISMGCIIVGYDVLDMLNRIYVLNGYQLQVVTRRGIEKEHYLDV
jgi:hypothetical protein